jgi:hypothetical protein
VTHTNRPVPLSYLNAGQTNNAESFDEETSREMTDKYSVAVEE